MSDKNFPKDFKLLKISADEMDYLSHRYEIRDYCDIFNWAIKLLYDIAKLDQGGWRLSFQKCDVDLEHNKVEYHKYHPIHFGDIANLVPNEAGFVRLPTPEFLDVRQKVQGDIK